MRRTVQPFVARFFSTADLVVRDFALWIWVWDLSSKRSSLALNLRKFMRRNVSTSSSGVRSLVSHNRAKWAGRSGVLTRRRSSEEMGKSRLSAKRPASRSEVEKSALPMKSISLARSDLTLNAVSSGVLVSGQINWQ